MKQMIEKRIAVFIGLIITLLSTSPLLAQDTPLDARRLATIHQYDTWQTLGPEDPGYPTPNLTIIYGTHQNDFQSKAICIFALVQQGEADASRLDEANQILRYVINAWPAYGPGDIIGQYADAWNHRERNMGVRLYYLYKEYMDADIRQDFDNRMGWAVDEPFDRKSENIKATNNSLIFLAHEATGQTALPSFTNAKNWWLDKLRYFGNSGFHEWGSCYNGSTLGAVLNLADFAQDQEIKKLAEMVMDYTLGCSAGFQIDGFYNSPTVRQYGFWIIAPFIHDGVAPHYYDTETQTDVIHSLFYGEPPIEFWNDWVEWAISNYRPPTVIEYMTHNNRNSETYLTTDDRWHMYSYIMDRGAIATHHTLVNNYYANPGETHDIIQCIIQSDAGPTNHILTHAIAPKTEHLTGCEKRRTNKDRSFGYKNVAIVNGGAFTRCVWASGGISDVPIRIFYSKDFTAELISGWAFFTDSNIYAAWAPTIGDPIADPDSATWTDPIEHGSWLKSDYTPADDSDGEAAVVEVGDPESFGSYEAFKTEILTRNSRPRWISDKVIYIARDGTEIEFGLDYAKLDGVNVNPASYPRASSNIGIDDYVFDANGHTIEFDFDAIQIHGLVERLGVSRYYGLTPLAPVAIIQADRISGQPPLEVTFDGLNSYDPDYGEIISYEWDFDNNGTVDDSGGVVSHTYQTDGTYTCKLTVVDDDSLPGEKTIDVYVIANPIDDAVLISNTIPNTMRVGQTVTVEVTMENTGNTTWNPTEKYGLHATGNMDVFSEIQQLLDEGETVPPGAQKTFTFDMTAPLGQGTYSTSWQMNRQTGQWFGPVHSEYIDVVSMVSIDLGTTDIEDGLYRSNDIGDGDTVPATIGGRDCRKNEDPASDFYMYYSVDDSWAYQGNRPDVYITIEYYDSGTGFLLFQYDSTDPAPFPDDIYKNDGSVTLTNTNTWKQHTYHITDARFANRQQSGSDFRIFAWDNGGIDFYLDTVMVFEESDFTCFAADFDGDNDIDQDDFAHLQVCYSPSSGGILDGCEDCDLNNDGTVDHADYNIFEGCATGPNIPIPGN